MKSLFKSLFSKSSSRKEEAALAWLDELNQVDDITALQKAMQHLQMLTNDDSLTNAERFSITLMIDQKNRQRVHAVTDQFTAFETLRNEIAVKTSEATYFYHRQIYASYRNIINYFVSNPDNTVLSEKQLPLVVGRSMQAIYSMMKWRFFIQQAIADNAWLELFSLYQILEEASLTNTTLQLYEGETEVNLSAAFTQACMLGTLDYGSMSKQKTKIAVSLLEKWCTASKPSVSYLPQRHLYYIDFKKDSAAKRIRHFQPTPSCRYWDIDQLAAKIKLAIASVEDKQPLEYLELGELMNNENLLDVLIMMRSEWSRIEYRRQRRSEDRKKVVKSVAVTYGIEDICSKIKALGLNSVGRPADNYSLDERLMNARSIGRNTINTAFGSASRERWHVNDESASGFGILVTEELNEQAKIGKLVGLIYENSKDGMIIGTIRSVKKLPNGHHHIGVKVLARHAKAIQLKTSSNNTTANGHAPFAGLYIAVEPGLTIWPSLLLPKLKFQQNKLYEIMHADKKVAVQLGAATESRDDWAKVNWPD